MALPSRYGIDKKINSMEGMSAYENGGKGSGNFGHAGRPGEVGGSVSEGNETSSKNEDVEDVDKTKDKKTWYDDGDFGQAPMIIDEKDGKYKVKSFGTEEATRDLLEADSMIRDAGGIEFDKKLKGEKADDRQKGVLQQLESVKSLLRQQVSELGDAMSFKDKNFDYDNFDTVVGHAEEFSMKAYMRLTGDYSKIGKSLKSRLESLDEARQKLMRIADSSKLKANKEAQWYDIDDKIKKR